MHVPFSPYCWSMPGGPVHHIRLWWEYKARPDLRRQTLCRLGRHYWVEAWRRDLGEVTCCRYCWAEP